MGSVNNLQPPGKMGVSHAFAASVKADHSEQIMTLLELQLTMEEYYLQFYEYAPIGYYILNQGDIISHLNHAAANLLGLSRDSTIKRSFTRYIAPDYQYIFSDFKQRLLLSQKTELCELKFFKKNGPLFYAQLEGRIFNNVDNETKILLTVSGDRKRKFDQDKHPYPIATLDNFISESTMAIVHELNHPHAVISNYIYGLLERLEKGSYKKEDLIHSLQQARKQLQRANDIVLHLENYTCKGILKFEQMSMGFIIKETLNNIHTEMAAFPIAIDYKELRPDVIVNVDYLHIQQVIVNLVRNAREAMLDSQIAAPKLTITARLINKENIEVSILDNGPGLCSKSQSSLFSPYFSTKSYGIGLGLAISRAVMEAHQGSLAFESNFPQGACFKMILPVKELIKV